MEAPDERDWWIYRGTGRPLDPAERDRRWPLPPRWRQFHGGPDEPPPPDEDADAERRLGAAVISSRLDETEADLVNAALYLRRPLLVTGPPGAGRSTLAYRVARELRLGRVLRWPITTQATLRAGLYERDTSRAYPEVGEAIYLGPLGTALLPYRLPRVLLIDGLDVSDIDLPFQLATILDHGEFEIPELARARGRSPQAVVHTADPGRTATVRFGRVRCNEFPLVVMTSGDERDLPSALRRQVLHLRMPEPDAARLMDLVAAHFPEEVDGAEQLVRAFLQHRAQADGLVPDQLLDALHLRVVGALPAADPSARDRLLGEIWRPVPAAGP